MGRPLLELLSFLGFGVLKLRQLLWACHAVSQLLLQTMQTSGSTMIDHDAVSRVPLLICLQKFNMSYLPAHGKPIAV